MIYLRAESLSSHPPLALLEMALAATSAEHPIRRQILEILGRQPGLHLRELARLLEIPAGHAEHHLRALERTGFLRAVRDARYLRYWPTQETPVGRVHALTPEERDLVRFLRRPTSLQILVRLAVQSGQTLSQLAVACGVTPSTAHYHLHRLHKAELVEVRDVGGKHSWRPKDPALLRRLLMEYEPPPEMVAGFLKTWDRLSP